MKRITVFVCVLFCLSVGHAQDLSYYLPDSVTYNPSIPKPKDVIYHEVGEWHVTHDRLVNYMKAIAAAAPDREAYVDAPAQAALGPPCGTDGTAGHLHRNP